MPNSSRVKKDFSFRDVEAFLQDPQRLIDRLQIESSQSNGNRQWTELRFLGDPLEVIQWCRFIRIAVPRCHISMSRCDVGETPAERAESRVTGNYRSDLIRAYVKLPSGLHPDNFSIGKSSNGKVEIERQGSSQQVS